LLIVRETQEVTTPIAISRWFMPNFQWFCPVSGTASKRVVFVLLWAKPRSFRIRLLSTCCGNCFASYNLHIFHLCDYVSGHHR